MVMVDVVFYVDCWLPCVAGAGVGRAVGRLP